MRISWPTALTRCFSWSQRGHEVRDYANRRGGSTMNPIPTLSARDAKKKVFSLFEEFKEFAFKGSVVDLAIGVIIGAAFSNIVKSLVDNIIMPLLSLIIPGEKGYEHWAVTIDGKTVPYGKFIGDV